MIASTGIAGIIGLIIGWIIAVIFVIMTIIMLSGKGSRFVAGFNTMSETEKKPYDETKISKNTGKVMILIDIILIGEMIILQFTRSLQALKYSSIIFCACVIVIPIAASIVGFKKSIK